MSDEALVLWREGEIRNYGESRATHKSKEIDATLQQKWKAKSTTWWCRWRCKKWAKPN